MEGSPILVWSPERDISTILAASKFVVPWYTMPPKKKACKVRHVDEVTAPKHGHRQHQEHERSVTPDGGEIDEVAVADRIYARIARAVQGGERRRERCTFREFHKQNPPTFDKGPDPMAAENWLLKIEKSLRALECTNTQKESEKKQGPFNSQHGKGQGHKKGFFKNLGNRGQSSRHSKSAYPQPGDKKSCSRCGKLHDGQNCDGVKIFFTCKPPGHFARDCPSSKGSGSSSSSQVAKGNENGKKVQGRVYALTTQDAQVTDTMVAVGKRSSSSGEEDRQQ
nr:hypothetical protein CFP56_72440 [Quercus suber]